MIIFSVNQYGSISDINNHNYVRSLLERRGVKYINVSGVSNRKAESSFMVSSKFLSMVRTIAKEYKQHSIMVIDDATRIASYQNVHTKKETKLGLFRQVDNIVDYEDYSCINGKYFSAILM